MERSGGSVRRLRVVRRPAIFSGSCAQIVRARPAESESHKSYDARKPARPFCEAPDKGIERASKVAKSNVVAPVLTNGHGVAGQHGEEAQEKAALESKGVPGHPLVVVVITTQADPDPDGLSGHEARRAAVVIDRRIKPCDGGQAA